MVIKFIAAIGIATFASTIIVALTAPALPVQFTVIHECAPVKPGYAIWR